MKEVTYETVTIKQPKTTKVFCNRCGTFSNNDYDTDIEEWVHEFGYGSRYDTEVHIFHLCDECYTEIINDFEIPPSIESSY
jgi:hypothetical protein